MSQKISGVRKEKLVAVAHSPVCLLLPLAPPAAVFVVAATHFEVFMSARFKVQICRIHKRRRLPHTRRVCCRSQRNESAKGGTPIRDNKGEEGRMWGRGERLTFEQLMCEGRRKRSCGGGLLNCNQWTLKSIENIILIILTITKKKKIVINFPCHIKVLISIFIAWIIISVSIQPYKICQIHQLPYFIPLFTNISCHIINNSTSLASFRSLGCLKVVCDWERDRCIWRAVSESRDQTRLA